MLEESEAMSLHVAARMFGFASTRFGNVCPQWSKTCVSARGNRLTNFVAGTEANSLRDQMAKLPQYRQHGWWARLGLNQRPLRCQRSALPLSYAPAEFGPRL